MTDLLDLAVRIEGAEGPDRELDAAIFLAVHRKIIPNCGRVQRCVNCHCGGRAVLLNCVEPTTNGGRPCFWWYTKNGSSGGTEDVPYTASLDAAMGLVPEGWTGLNDNTSGTWIVELFPPDFDPNDWNLRPIQRAKHKSFALALCAAALRARAAQDVSQ